jgi:hypothetical protein
MINDIRTDHCTPLAELRKNAIGAACVLLTVMLATWLVTIFM